MTNMFHDKFCFLRQILMTVPLHRVSMVEFVPTNLIITDVTVVLDGVARTVISVRYFCSSGLISARYQATVYHSSLSYQCLKTDSLVSPPDFLKMLLHQYFNRLNRTFLLNAGRPGLLSLEVFYCRPWTVREYKSTVVPRMDTPGQGRTPFGVYTM